ncbi:phage/plasmid primase, P4 family [Ornithinibacillus sp. JPR2-1]|uniref:DNA primase family protein n=1 Tax=Ornithinibacillus sp. JPR2-1 TaxID=2094019 RepID=UPI0031D142AE
MSLFKFSDQKRNEMESIRKERNKEHIGVHLIPLRDEKSSNKNISFKGTESQKEYYNYDKDGNITGFIRGVFVEELVNKIVGFCLNQDFYIYLDGYYKKMTDSEIKGFIQNQINPRVRTGHIINDVFNMWQFHTSMQVDENEVNKDNNLLNLKNGIYDVEKDLFTPRHDKNHLITIRINASYKEGLTKEVNGKAWHNYLDYALPDKEVQCVLQEIMGYCLTRYVDAKKFFVFDGVSNSGKSKIIEILTYLIGNENVSNVALQNLYGFNIQYLYNKTLNVFADLPNTPISDDNQIKVLTGEDEALADRKHKEAFKFYNRSKMLFSTNGMPSNYGDKSEAFYNRLMIIPFKYAKPQNELDSNLGEKFKNEADYIFMWALEGLKRLYSRGFKFSDSRTVLNEVLNYKTESSTLHQFVKEECKFDSESKITTERFMREYKDFCKFDLGIKTPLGRNKVLKTLQTEFGCQYGDNIKENGKRAIKGIRIPSIQG